MGQVNMTQLTSDLDISDNDSIVNEADYMT